MAGELKVNGTDLAELGVTVERLSGWRDGPRLVSPSAPLLGRLGRVSLAGRPAASAREITAEGVQNAATVEELLPLRDRLLRTVYDGIVSIIPLDQPERVFYGYTVAELSEIAPAITQNAHRVRLVFRCDDPLAYDVATTVIDLTGGAQELPLGTGVSMPRIVIGDNVTNPVLILRDYLGQEVARMELTATIAAGEWREIDSELQEITDQAGARRVAELTGGTFLKLEPRHAAPGVSGPWPTLEVSGGGIARVEYERAWM